MCLPKAAREGGLPLSGEWVRGGLIRDVSRRPGSGAGLADVSQAPEFREDAPDGEVGRDVSRVDLDVRVFRRLPGIVDPGEAPDEPGAGLCVETLGVSGLAGPERGRDMDLDEAPDRFDAAAQLAPAGGVGRDESADRDAAMPGDLARDEADAPQVDLAVLAGEAAFARQEPAHGVPVEQRHAPAFALAQHRCKGARERGLARPGQSREHCELSATASYPSGLFGPHGGGHEALCEVRGASGRPGRTAHE